MKVRNLLMEGVGGVRWLNLSPNSGINLLCGPNGVGKTTILETISHVFSHGQTILLKRNVGMKDSRITVSIDSDGEVTEHTMTFDTFRPEEATQIKGLHTLANKLISLKASRTFQYQPLEGVNKDAAKQEHILWQDAINGINLNEIKNWFVNRYLYSAHPGALTNEQLSNYELAKACFSFLNADFTFSRVDATSNEILVNTPSGEIYYEYLSSGFKSIIAILFGIIKEIEFRFKEPTINAQDFDGIILIDELELHLHPEWQEKVAGVLLDAFPKAQFFASTHSPHVIQAAERDQIIALGFDETNVVQRALPKSPFGFQGWTIEEVLTDVMGMSTLRTEIFSDRLQIFQQSIDDENFEMASAVYKEIDVLLHPQNHLRKLLKFQLAAIQ